MDQEKDTNKRSGPRKDKYYRVHFQVAGKKHFVGIGRESEGWTLDKVVAKRLFYMENTKKGVKPRSPKEETELAQEAARIQEEKEKEHKKELITFSEFWIDRYYKHNAKKSWRHEKSFYKNWIKPDLGDLPLKKIKWADIEPITVKMRAKGSSARNVQYCLAVIRQVFNRAIDLDLYDFVNPVKKGKVSGANRQRKRVLTAKEENKLFTALSNKSKKVHNMAYMSLYTGMRFSEVARMKWSDIDWKNGKIEITNAKDPNNKDKTRYAYMPDHVKDMLADLSQGSTTDLVYPDATGKVMTNVPKTFQRTVDDLKLNNGLEKGSLDKLVFYSLRHTFASRLAEQNVHQFIIMELLGHTKPSMTQRYMHYQDAPLRKTVQLLGNNQAPGKVLQINQ